jgi:hypothetical protein
MLSLQPFLCVLPYFHLVMQARTFSVTRTYHWTGAVRLKFPICLLSREMLIFVRRMMEQLGGLMRISAMKLLESVAISKGVTTT